MLVKGLRGRTIFRVFCRLPSPTICQRGTSGQALVVLCLHKLRVVDKQGSPGDLAPGTRSSTLPQGTRDPLHSVSGCCFQQTRGSDLVPQESTFQGGD